MGFNFSGIAINRNFKNNFEQIQKEFNWKLEKQSDINFEVASANWKREGICDVYFTDSGTLLFLNMDMCAEPWELRDANTLTFALSETSMAFTLNYCENGINKRSLMEVNRKRMVDEGEKLPVEAASEHVDTVIWHQIETVIGQSFGSIDLSATAERYVFVKEKKAPAVTQEQKVRQALEESPVWRALLTDELRKKGIQTAPKKWWQFWK